VVEAAAGDKRVSSRSRAGSRFARVREALVRSVGDDDTDALIDAGRICRWLRCTLATIATLGSRDFARPRRNTFEPARVPLAIAMRAGSDPKAGPCIDGA